MGVRYILTTRFGKGNQMTKLSLQNTSLEGIAALSICESLLIALGDLKVISVQDTRDILTDAATAHRNVDTNADRMKQHEAIALIIDRIRTSSNSVPHVI
jgi:hypothetical protein